MISERNELIERYIVFRLKLLELFDITTLNVELAHNPFVFTEAQGFDVDRPRETLLGAAITAYMALADNPKRSTNARSIWQEICPQHARAINRIWDRNIRPGELVMKSYRDQAGAHGDKAEKYFLGKLVLFQEKRSVVQALKSFYGLSKCLLRRQDVELPGLSSEMEKALLNIELRWKPNEAFNRRWLRKMLLVDSGSFTKIFR